VRVEKRNVQYEGGQRQRGRFRQKARERERKEGSLLSETERRSEQLSIALEAGRKRVAKKGDEEQQSLESKKLKSNLERGERRKSSNRREIAPLRSF